jgi:hypothetical protein
VITYDNCKREQFREVEEEYCIIQTGRTEDARGLLEQLKKNFLPSGTKIVLDDDS